MTREELGILLLSDCDRLGERVVVAVGKGRILGPVAVKDAHGQPCTAAGYMILHTDEVDPGEAVTVLVESPRLEPPI